MSNASLQLERPKPPSHSSSVSSSRPHVGAIQRGSAATSTDSVVPSESEEPALVVETSLEGHSNISPSSLLRAVKDDHRLEHPTSQSLSRAGAESDRGLRDKETNHPSRTDFPIPPSSSQSKHIEPLVAVNHPSSSQPSGVPRPLRSPKGLAKRLSHLTPTGDAHMVDISHKAPTRRSAAATAFVLFGNPHPYRSLTYRKLRKGDAIAVARIAGIQAAKKTADLIPLAHPGLGLTAVKVNIELLAPSSGEHGSGPDPDTYLGEAGFEFGGAKITTHVSCDGKTGVEMEALTAATTAALTMYDMCKAVDKHMLITGARVILKKGGKSGYWSLKGDIPDSPSASPPIFAPVLQRRMAGIVNEPEQHHQEHIGTLPPPPGVAAAAVAVASDPLNPTPELEDQDLTPIAPPATPAFLRDAAAELDLFIANTTSPSKAAEIAGLRRSHKALTARIREMQRRTEHGVADADGNGSGPIPKQQHHNQQQQQAHQQPRDGRVDSAALHRLHQQRRDLARRVLGWRIGGGSEIQEASEREIEEGGDGQGTTALPQSGRKPEDMAPGEWRWEAGVYGPWKTTTPETADAGASGRDSREQDVACTHTHAHLQ